MFLKACGAYKSHSNKENIFGNLYKSKYALMTYYHVHFNFGRKWSTLDSKVRYFDILTLKNTRHDKLIKLCFNKNINYPQKLIVTNSTLLFKNISFADGYLKKESKIKNKLKELKFWLRAGSHNVVRSVTSSLHTNRSNILCNTIKLNWGTKIRAC